MSSITEKIRFSFGVGAIFTMLAGAFYFGGDNQAIKSSIAQTIAVQQARQEEVNRRLERMEEKLDRLLAQALTRLKD
jgi:CHASE3 domain sensor protein